MESLYFLIPLFFIVLMVMPLNIILKTALNVDDNVLLISIFLWKIKLKTIKLTIQENKIFVITTKKKEEIKLTVSDKQIYFVEQLVNNIKDKIQPRKVCVYAKVGVHDAKNTAIVCGTLCSVVKILFCYLKNKKPTCSMYEQIYPCFNQNICIICGYLSLTISLFDILYSLVISLFSLRSKIYER